jgi:CTP synthase
VLFEDAGLGDLVCERLSLGAPKHDLSEWRKLVDTIKHPQNEVTIAIVGKYTDNGDAYISIAEALKHGGIASNAHVNIRWIESDEIEENEPATLLNGADALVVAPGFGARGVEGKIRAIQYARETKLPFLGLCFGLQMAVIEYARNVCGLEGAHTEEVDPNTPYPVIHLLPDQIDISDKGGTMRLGAYPCRITSKTLAHRLYGDSVIDERHRHRYEVNNEYRETLSQRGMVFSGVSPDYRLVEIVEVSDHPYFIATQFHPEFKSRPNRPHPLFAGLVKAALDRCKKEAVAVTQVTDSTVVTTK